MYTRRPTDQSYCTCCAADFAPEQLVWAGLMYSIPVLVCNVQCLHTLEGRWAPSRWSVRTAYRTVVRAVAQWRRRTLAA